MKCSPRVKSRIMAVLAYLMDQKHESLSVSTTFTSGLLHAISRIVNKQNNQYRMAKFSILPSFMIWWTAIVGSTNLFMFSQSCA